jgi:BRO family, N-terminal domain
MAPDGKLRETHCANTEGLFRIIQSIPSPKAEPFKRWLAQVGYERVKEIENPELASARARELYQAKGYPQAWIEKRLRSISVRGELMDEWKARRSYKRSSIPPLRSEAKHRKRSSSRRSSLMCAALRSIVIQL